MIVSGKELSRIEDDNSVTAIASTSVENDWVWSHAVLPPPGHPLATEAGAFYILEFNPTTEQSRVLRIGP